MFQSFMEMWNVYPFTRQKSQTQTWCIQISFSARWLQKRWGPHLCIYYLVFSVRWRLSATLCAWRVEADSELLVTDGFICCMWAMARLLGSRPSYSPKRLLLSEENLRGLFTDPLLPLRGIYIAPASLSLCVGCWWSLGQVWEPWAGMYADLVPQGARANSSVPLVFPVCLGKIAFCHWPNFCSRIWA